MGTLKKIISRYMTIVTLIFISIILIIILAIQIRNEQNLATERATRTFQQMQVLLRENQRELTTTQIEYDRTCLRNAEAIAYMIEDDPTILEGVVELTKIKKFIEVDEIHILDENGYIYAGTHPEYYGYSLESGEQMSFFLPMLKNRALKLVQEMMPNSMEGKVMQYSALWSVNREFIVLVGMEPVSVMEATEKNEISYIFSLFRVNPEADYYAIDVETGEIVGATNVEQVGKHYSDIGFKLKDIQKQEEGFHRKINGVSSFCVFTRIGDNYIGRTIASVELYHRIPSSLLLYTICFVFIAGILVWAVTRYMNLYVVEGIYQVNEKLRMISKGNLEETVEVKNSIEFSELSSYINEMVKSLLDNNRKMSYVLSKTNMYIGVYEYNQYRKKVRFTEYIPQILSMDLDKAEQFSADYQLFEEYIEKIRENPVPDEKAVFKLPSEEERYIKLEESHENDEIFGVIIDVTEDIRKRRKIEGERDIDSLTDLLNRRGLDTKLSQLFSQPDELGFGALVMMDADGLKGINDTYGHEMGDIYLQKISEILKNFGKKKNVSSRQGGDEYVLFLYGYDDEEELLEEIHSLENLQDESWAELKHDLRVPLRFSLGYTLTHGKTDYQDMIKEADEKMYMNKRNRKKQPIS